MDSLRTGLIPALGRVLLAAIFLQGGYGKALNPEGTIAYIAQGGLPLPQAAYGVALAIELGAAGLLLIGFQTRLMAFVLAGWCLVTAVLFHYVPGDRANMINFMKNVAMAGGFLQVLAWGAGSWSVDALFSQRRRVPATA